MLDSTSQHINRYCSLPIDCHVGYANNVIAKSMYTIKDVYRLKAHFFKHIDNFKMKLHSLDNRIVDAYVLHL